MGEGTAGTSGRTGSTATPDGPRGLVVAIDGPSGSGKSTVSRRVATALGVRYLDTGAMYRALTWWALDQGVDLADAAAVAGLARRLPLVMVQDPGQPRVLVGEVDVTAAIRETRVSEAVSAVATNLEVRAELVRRQRELIAAAVEADGGIVAEGRDITTVVAPQAPVRILLTADESARLARRAREVHGEDSAEALAATRAQVVVRDAKDSTVSQFLAPAEGVVEIDSSHLGIDDVVAAVLAQVERPARGLAAGR